jgi:parallel beta-helix repeat protein
MRKPAALFTVALALGAAFHAPGASANEPTKITECRTIGQPGSYVLAKNLTAAGNCLVVVAEFVTVDLAGFLITGDGTGAGIRADAAGPEAPRGIAVRNGTIAGFEFGAFLQATGSIVEGLRVVGNTSVGMFVSPGGIVRGNTAVGNGIHGIVAVGTVSGNTAEDNGTGIGILISSGGSTVSGNTARNNRGVGISVFCPSNVIGNTATGNAGGNLTLRAGCTNIDNLAP